MSAFPKFQIDEAPSTPPTANETATGGETPIERIARLDAERNQQDRKAGRGFDYARSHAPNHIVHVSPHVDFVIEANSEFGNCDVCGDPAALVINPPCPSCRRVLSVGFRDWRCKCGWSGKVENPVIKRFCGIECLQNQQGAQ